MDPEKWEGFEKREDEWALRLFIREVRMSVRSSLPFRESQGSVCLTWLKISRMLSSDTEKKNPSIKLKGAIGYFQRSFHPPGWSEETFSVFCEEALKPVHSPCQGQGFAYEPVAWPDFVVQANRGTVQGKWLCDCYSVSHCLHLRKRTFHNLNNLLRVYYTSSLRASDNGWNIEQRKRALVSLQTAGSWKKSCSPFHLPNWQFP